MKLLLRTKMDAAEAIRSYRGPLLQFHGDQDRIVPYERGRRLFEAANEPKKFVTLPGADHNDGWPPSFYDAIAKFIAEL